MLYIISIFFVSERFDHHCPWVRCLNCFTFKVVMENNCLYWAILRNSRMFLLIVRFSSMLENCIFKLEKLEFVLLRKITLAREKT